MHERGRQRYSSKDLQRWSSATSGSGARQLEGDGYVEIEESKPHLVVVPTSTREPVDITELRKGREQRQNETVIFSAVNEKKTELRMDTPVENYVAYFDTHWQREGLSQDWYRLQTLGGLEAGFSMKLQMGLLKDTRPESVKRWMEQTETDLLGFCLEYLAGGVVYPYQYRKQSDGKLIDMKYKKDILAVTSSQERDGVPKKKLQEAKDFLWSAPDNSMVVIPSPAGPTGLFTDKGEAIKYPDSYFFVLRKEGELVKGATFKTDFSRKEISQVIYDLTGRYIIPSAELTEFCQSAAFLSPETSDIQRVEDVVDVLKHVRSKDPRRSQYIFDKKTFDEVDDAVSHIDDLYNFGDNTKVILESLKSYTLSGEHSQEELEKALAATFYRLSKLFLFDKNKRASGKASHLRVVDSEYDENILYGDVLEKAAKIVGCAGGGSRGNKSYVDSLGGPRVGTTGEDDGPWGWGTCRVCNSHQWVGGCFICKKCVSELEGAA